MVLQNMDLTNFLFYFFSGGGGGGGKRKKFLFPPFPCCNERTPDRRLLKEAIGEFRFFSKTKKVSISRCFGLFL